MLHLVVRVPSFQAGVRLSAVEWCTHVRRGFLGLDHFSEGVQCELFALKENPHPRVGGEGL